MILIQLTGLSGAGKSTLSQVIAKQLEQRGYAVEIIDGDVYRRHLSSDLGFSKADRIENIRRLGFVGLTLAKHGIIVILAAINPYEAARKLLQEGNSKVKTVFLRCPIDTLIKRDPKGLYKRALLPEGDPNRVLHFTGISDPYEVPEQPDLVLDTNLESPEQSAERLLAFILENIKQY